ncbi:TauD/TfdA family dioxygenase [Aquimarina sp. I32.4]|uniref:TauD/TfdA family dioxygenase n=1 Tax=Aquimarina sp. I32.4 TaxID=2053903 RepID=UPI000CDECAAD|nr:TauD/TfdA family dioxygenase [Aquimarina sp. I32.4]
MNKDFYTIKKQEQYVIDHVLEELVEKYGDIKNYCFLENASYYATKLPFEIWDTLNKFKYREDNCGLVIIRGYEFKKNEIGDTPSTIASASKKNLLQKKIEFFLALCSSILGDLFSWNTQQNGKILNDIIPLKESAYEQLGTSSKTELKWHIEEAFHEHRPDYVGLMCLKNPDDVATLYSNIRNISLNNEQKDLLFQEKFMFEMDLNFSNSNYNTNKPVSILFGNYDEPYVRIDPAFMKKTGYSPEIDHSVNVALDLIEKNIKEIILKPGDICFFDNYRTVHGRAPFDAKFDGNDRWLKRVLITRDLRKSSEFKNTNRSRVIHTDVVSK